MTSRQTLCALCLGEVPLRRSHLIPRALFRMCRLDSAANPNPVVMGEKRPYLTSHQPVRRLLCAKCEQRLSSGGETYVVGGCYRPDGSFAIRHTLRSSIPHATVGGDPFYYGTHVRDLDVHALRFFAASVFWRASVTTWPVSGGGPVKNTLGKYEEPFRRFLLQQSPFPASARLLAWVSSEDDPPRMVSFPRAQRRAGHHSHDFYIPGLHFILVVGGVLPAEIRSAYKVRTDELPIFVANARSGGFFQQIVKEIRRTTPDEYQRLIAKARGKAV